MRAVDFRWIIATQGRDGAEIHTQLKAFGLAVQQACCLHRVAQALEVTDLPVVVVSQLALPDGNWRDMVQLVSGSGTGNRVLLCVDQLTNELWWDAEELGVLDVITRPYIPQLMNLISNPMVMPETQP